MTQLGPHCPGCTLGEKLQKDFPRQHLCMETRPWFEPAGADTALLMIAKAPGRDEDKQGKFFVGASGWILDAWCDSLNFQDHVDIFLTNAVRCRLFQDDDPLRKSDTDRCRQYLAADLEKLQRDYSRVILLFLGGASAQAYGLKSIREASRFQGQPVTICKTVEKWRQSKNRRIIRFTANEKNYRTYLPRFLKKNDEVPVGTFPAFITYHPAACLPSRDPAKVHAVCDHLQLLSDFCLNLPPKNHDLSVPRLAVPPPSNLPDLVGLDIETYGILNKFPPQTVFHPTKSVAVDRISRHDLIQTCSLAWYAPDGSIQTTVFLWGRPDHRTLLLTWLRLLRARRCTLLCMNTLFDVTYLRYADPRFREAVSEPLILEDVAIWNYLNNSVRPEKNLEALSRLFGFIPLAHSATKKFRRYDRVDDPDLLHYNAADSELALKLRAHLRRQLDRDASSEYARRYFSDLLWSCIEMTEAGVAFDSDELCKLLGRCENTKQKTSHFTVKAGYGPLHGPGSPATASRIVREAVEIAGLATDKRLKRTKQRGLVSTEKDNIQLLRGALPADDTAMRPLVEALSEHRGAVKIITSYVKPLLPRLAKDRKQLLIDGIAYPQYYPAPQSYGEAGGGVVEGGTVQARPTCKQPALQTAPESVQLCFTSRHMPGALLKIDLSQIELRLAAFLSGDKKMLAEYRAGADRHALMAIAFFGPDIVNKPDFKKWRQVGKQGRFWQIYRGGPRILQEQVRRRCGVELPFEQCCDFERQLPQENPDLYEWQEEQIRSTTRLGYVTAPILGDRRWLSRSECVNQTTYESTICNFPIQVTAARLMMDLQAGLRRHAKTLGLRGVITLNIFDAIYIDCPLAEERMWPKIFRTALHRSTFWRKLQTETGRSIPLGFDTTIRRFLPCNSY